MKYKVIKDFPGYKKGEEVGKMFTHGRELNPADYPEYFQPTEEKPKTVWDIKEDDKYFYIDLDSDIVSGSWCGFTSDYDRLYIGNIFLTEEEAEKELEKRRLITKLLRSKEEMGVDKEFAGARKNYQIYERFGKIEFLDDCEYFFMPILGYFKERNYEYIEKNKEDILRLFDLLK